MKLTDEERVEHKRKSAKKWKAKNPEKTRSYQKKWVSKNKDKLAEYSRRYQSRNRLTADEIMECYFKHPGKFKDFVPLERDKKTKELVFVTRNKKTVER